MGAWLRRGFILLMLAGIAALAFVIARHATPGQPMSLSVFVDGGSDALRTVDRLGKTVTRMSVSEERRLGDQIARQVEEGYGGAEGADLAAAERQRYVQEVTDLLVHKGGLRRPDISYVAKLLQSEVINAYSLPGGHVYVTSGMLALVESDAELAAIIGHEIAHVDLGHCIERIQYEEVARRLGGKPVATLVAIGAYFFSIGYADNEEADADRQGIIYAEKVGYHPQAGQLVFARLRDQLGEHTVRRHNIAGELEDMVAGALEDYFSTHPPSSVRIDNYDRVFREQRFNLEVTPYYVGRRNRAELRPWPRHEYADEFVTGRIYPRP